MKIMNKNVNKIYYFILILFMFSLIISYNSKKNELKSKNQKTEVLKSIKYNDTIKLSDNIEVIRENNNNCYIDFLVFNHCLIDSSKTIPILDTSECNFYIKTGKRVDTTCKSFLFFGKYLLITKNEVQNTSIKVYNLDSKNRLPLLSTEELIVDPINNELFLIRNRGILHNYILRLKLSEDIFLKLDSVENTKKNRQKLKLEN